MALGELGILMVREFRTAPVSLCIFAHFFLWTIVRWEVDEDPRPLQSFPAPKGAKRLFVSEDSKVRAQLRCFLPSTHYDYDRELSSWLSEECMCTVLKMVLRLIGFPAKVICFLLTRVMESNTKSRAPVQVTSSTLVFLGLEIRLFF